MILILQPDDAGGIRHQLGAIGEGIGFVDGCAAGAHHQIFVGLAYLGMGRPALPDALGDLVHGGIFPIPKIKVTHHGNTLGMGRPYTEDKAFGAVAHFGMTT